MQVVLPILPFLRCLSGAVTGRLSASVRLSRELSGRETIRLSPQRRLVVLCSEGSVWITGGRDPRDVVLRAGDQFEVKGGTSVVIEGLKESRIEVAS